METCPEIHAVAFARDVRNLPLRNGNALTLAQDLTAVTVRNLPLRNGNSDKDDPKRQEVLVRNLPLRNGNYFSGATSGVFFSLEIFL